MNRTLRRLSHSFDRARQTTARRFFWDRQADQWRRELVSLGLRARTHARLVDVHDETADTRTLVLEPPRSWSGHRAGQWVSVALEVDGVQARRCYSISNAPGEPYVHLTIKRVPGGRVSNALHALPIGAHLAIGPADGDFVLPEEVPARLLFVSAGSGITPSMAMLLDLERRGELGDVVVVHHARRRDDVIFAGALQRLASCHAGLRLVLCLDDEESGAGGFDEARLRALVPDLASRETYVCGPPAVVTRVDAMWREAGLADRLHAERFASPPPVRVSTTTPEDVVLRVRGRAIPARTDRTLLEQLEDAGLNPPSGCRMGICRSCTSIKHSGAVRHTLTGVVSDAADEAIPLCVSTPCSDVALRLGVSD
ncbi:MAG: ferredoxin reductase [Polyangiales bacterium]|nr:ferredoxin reductase [Myxococcales bacterium]